MSIKRVTFRKGSVVRYGDTEESKAKLKKMGFKEVDSKPVKVEDDKEPEADKEPEGDKEPEADKEPEGDKEPEADEKPKGTRRSSKK